MRYFYLVLQILWVGLMITGAGVSAQTSSQEKKADTVVRRALYYMNARMPDSVYSLAGEQFKKQLSAPLWNSVFRNNFTGILPITDILFINSKDGVNKYKLQGKVPLSFYASLDDQGKLKDFLFQPYKEEANQPAMGPEERKTDSLALKILSFINQKQTDSIYAYAGESFRQQLDKTAFKNIAENSVYPLTPFPSASFISSRNGVNKYKINQFQFLFSLDDKGKFSTLLLQPYREDAVKNEKALSDNPLKTSLDSIVDKVLSEYIQTKGNAGLSAGIYYKGKDYFYNYGETVMGNKQLPGNHTLYEIGSITKTFTATLLALAVNQGKVTLETSVTRFLPDSVASNPALKGITLKSLANHTSGLPRLPPNMSETVTDINQPYEHYDESRMFSFLKGFKAIRQPGASYEYSNLAVGLLGVILEKVYGRPYEELVSTYITKPSGMKETKITPDAAGMKLIAQGYNEQNQPVPVWKFQAVKAAGALKSSSNDLLHYGKLQIGISDKTLEKALKLTHRITFKNSSNIIGLGWHYLPDDENILQHSGGTGGYRAFSGVDLRRNIVVAVLTNNASTGDALGVRLIKAFQGMR